MRTRFLLALLSLMAVLALPIYAAEDKPTLPEGLKGFHGTLTGKVVSAAPDGLSLTLRVTAATVREKNKATDASSAVGKDLLIHAQWEKGIDGAMHPSEIHMQFIKNLKPGQATAIVVMSDENDRLHIVNLPTLTRE